ncbi:RHS repeat-associated core domain-containing protein [Flavihumibacter sp. CACIAM 22H1]|uniref:RHS repeat-associated core domain-containing protein n=1 Tax=Flavihumibacter sp. CACIAM 22H1 TaxID=1812911 RepID=UPI0007A8E574|nr:RHS repeat-associated core domain-containing protein [Flavihumibacter sp. CACIAM 22H1]KYP13819.1 MAG: hypothetical protein A1D16_11425 [Flavihumibacter sp. CACIAM 22H1]
MIGYKYDAGGNRISKSVAKPSGNTAYTWYVRDASGNVMSTYETSGTSKGLPATLLQREVHLYGSSRIGIFNRRVDAKQNYTAPTVFSSYRGQKFFELSNHLGNVLATISDRKNGFSTDVINIDYYESDVVTASDYYPFGMLMPGRQFGQGLNIAGGEFSETTEVNGYQVPVDLVLNTRSGTESVEYVASSSIELVGEFESGLTDEFEAYIADESYAGTGNIGGATGTAGLYRYGFNGKENDNEVFALGGLQDYRIRIYATRLGRFLATDPIANNYPSLTPYPIASNRPIDGIDLDGLEWYYYNNISGWTESKAKIPIMTPIDVLNKAGYYSAAQVHKMQEATDIIHRKFDRQQEYADYNKAMFKYAKSKNLFGIF